MRRVKSPKGWRVLSRFVQIKNPWIEVIGERLQDEAKNEYEYWRVEKPDGMLVLTKQGSKLLLPKSMYRPGVGCYTLDFCGGRIDSKDFEAEAKKIVCREFKIKSTKPFTSLTPITKRPWNIDSSFTNVKLYGYIAELSAKIIVKPENIEAAYEINKSGLKKLLDDLDCLQCRAMLREWLALRY